MMATNNLTNSIGIVEWATEQARSLLIPLGNRWLHVQGVVERARQISNTFNENDRSYLIAAAYLHDVGYAPTLKNTGFHPIDGAYFLKSQDQERLVSLVAYHSEAQYEAKLRGLLPELSKFQKENSLVADALTYCDMTTSPTGLQISFQERISNILERYGETDLISQAIKEAKPSLSLAIERTQQLLNRES